MYMRGQAQPTNESQIKSLNSEVHNIHMLKEINHNNGNEEQRWKMTKGSQSTLSNLSKMAH